MFCNMNKYSNFLEAYKEALRNVLSEEEIKVRGLVTKEILGYSFVIEDITKRFVLESNRERYLYAELLWYLCGTYNVQEIAPFSSFWLKIADSEGNVNSNYGHRIFRAEKTFFKALVQLYKDKNSRQALVHINLPKDIRLDNKDIPCTVFLHFFIRKNKLYMHVYIRSNDIWKGMTYDFCSFSMFQQIMLYFVKEKYPEVELGSMLYSIGSLHVYKDDYKKAYDLLNSELFMVDLKLKINPINEDGSAKKEFLDIFYKAKKNPQFVFEMVKYFE